MPPLSASGLLRPSPPAPSPAGVLGRSRAPGAVGAPRVGGSNCPPQAWSGAGSLCRVFGSTDAFAPVWRTTTVGAGWAGGGGVGLSPTARADLEGPPAASRPGVGRAEAVTSPIFFAPASGGGRCSSGVPLGSTSGDIASRAIAAPSARVQITCVALGLPKPIHQAEKACNSNSNRPLSDGNAGPCFQPWQSSNAVASCNPAMPWPPSRPTGLVRLAG